MSLLLLTLAGCAPDPGELASDCDPREMMPGEVRAKRIACEDELIEGGDGRVGDWLIENAVARFVIRDSYASLTQLGQSGGTLIDAAVPGGEDLLLEFVPEGDRTDLTLIAGDGEVKLDEGGVVWRLAADHATLALSAPDNPDFGQQFVNSAIWLPRPGVGHTGSTARADGAFLGVSSVGVVPGGENDGAVVVTQPSAVGVSSEEFYQGWSDAPLEVDADDVAVSEISEAIDRIPVVDGALREKLLQSWDLLAERPGCLYDRLAKLGCAYLTVRVRDEWGHDLPATVHFAASALGMTDYPIPAEGGVAPLGPTPGEVWVWAGPRFGAWRGTFSGVDASVEVTLPTVLDPELSWPEGAGPDSPANWASGGLVLAALGLEAAPDADHGEYSRDVIHEARSLGVGFATVLADDEVPVLDQDPHDRVLVELGSRANHDVWAWGFTHTTRRAGEGAVDWAGFGALDRLSLVRGGIGADRFTIVTRGWVDTAFAEARAWDWPLRPRALWLDSLEDLSALDTLANAWIDVAPVAERTWVAFDGAPNLAAFTAGLYSRQISAGNGPRVTLRLKEAPVFDRAVFEIEGAAPGWMGGLTAEVHTDRGAFPIALDADGKASFAGVDPMWAYATVEAPRSRPWGGDPAWAVSPVVWVRTGP